MEHALELVKAELIGKEAAIIDSKNKANIGIKGRIIDETKNTITIDAKSGKKRVVKQNVTIEITYDNKKVRIDGKMLSMAPEERIKIKVK